MRTAHFAAEYRVFPAEWPTVIHNRLSPQIDGYALVDRHTATVERPSYGRSL